MKLIDFANEISALLNMADYDGADSSLNGVQVGDLDSDIKKVAFFYLSGFFKSIVNEEK